LEFKTACVPIHIYTYTHTHIHTYTHTYNSRRYCVAEGLDKRVLPQKTSCRVGLIGVCHIEGVGLIDSTIEGVCGEEEAVSSRQ
jgi:hypothetical protein